MTINGIEVFPRYDQLRTIFALPGPKRRLVNEWGDAPTEVDTTEALKPSVQSVNEVIGVHSASWDALRDSIMQQDYSQWEVLGRTISIRNEEVRHSDFSDSLVEVSFTGFIDTPSITLGTTPVELSSVAVLLDGSKLSKQMAKIKQGAVVDTSVIHGVRYITRNAPERDRVTFTTKCLVKATADSVWTSFDALSSAIFSTWTLVDGVKCEYVNSTTTSVFVHGDSIFIDLDITFSTL